jgi:hypothetical protein
VATTLVVDLIKRASELLYDDTNVRWTKEALLSWLNAAQKAIVLQKPDSHVVNEDFNCNGGTTKQSLPDNGLRLLEVVRNVTEDSTGEAISVVSRDVMDTTVPDWHSSTPTINIENYVFDERDPKHFYVYPAPDTDTLIEIIYSKAPGLIVVVDYNTDSQTITLDDVYENVILDYMLYRAYAKDAEYSKNGRQSLNHYNDFANAIGMKMKVDIINSPNEQS